METILTLLIFTILPLLFYFMAYVTDNGLYFGMIVSVVYFIFLAVIFICDNIEWDCESKIIKIFIVLMVLLKLSIAMYIPLWLEEKRLLYENERVTKQVIDKDRWNRTFFEITINEKVIIAADYEYIYSSYREGKHKKYYNLSAIEIFPEKNTTTKFVYNIPDDGIKIVKKIRGK